MTMAKQKPAIILIIIIFSFLLSANTGNPAYAASWVDGTSRFNEEAQLLAQLLGNEDGFMLAPSIVNASKDPAYKVGDKRNFYATNMGNKTQYSLKATLRAVSDRAYIFVEEGRPATTGNINSLLSAFDGIYDSVTELFGSPPDRIDSDPRIYILIMDITSGVQADGAQTVGYFSPIDEYRDAQLPPWINLRSNEVEILYIDYISLSFDKGGAESVVAHEFTHLVQWARDPSESVWINEGIAVYIESILGYEVNSRIADFEKNPETPLLEWSSSLADYAASYLFFKYLSERFGELAISTIVRNVSHGTTGIERALAMQGDFISFHEIFSDWVIANYLDDPDLENGIYGYSSLDIHLNPSVVEVQYPIDNKTSKVKPWTARYIEFKKEQDDALSLSIYNNGDDIVDQIIEIGNETNISPLRPLGAQSGSALVSEESDKTILVITSQPDPPELISPDSAYTYSAEIHETVTPVEPASSRKITTWGSLKRN